MGTQYPLKWPEGWPRTKMRRASQFKVEWDKAVRELGREIELIGGRYPLLTTNYETTIDGRPRRNVEPSDPGVAVYFELKGKQQVFACDSYYTVRDNVRAISRTIEAIRTIERHGSSQMMERTLTAFEALPAPKSWQKILGLENERNITRDRIDEAWRRLSKQTHPDVRGGSGNAQAELNAARDEAIRSLPP